MKKYFFFFILFLSANAYSAENYDMFCSAQTIPGPTGNIETYSPYILNNRVFSFGLHRFIVGLGYGWFNKFEAGISFDLKEMSPLFPMDDENIRKKTEEISFHSKFGIFNENIHPLSLAIGQRRDTAYVSFGKLFKELYGSTLQGGLTVKGSELNTFFAYNQSKSWEQFIMEYKSNNEELNFGWRFLLSPEMKLDFFMLDITRPKNIFFDNFIFGITVTG